MNSLEIIESLEILRSGDIPDDRYGICGNLLKMGFKGAYKFVAANCLGWEFDTGVRAHPVPEEVNPEFKWRGESLTLRISLIDYLIKRVKEQDYEIQC